MTEAFLQYIWQHRLLQGDLQTADGLPVVVERPGQLNRDAGPDFFDARVKIGDTLWAGNVEVHVKASDWNAHRHALNRAYDNVVLHVVYKNDAPVTLQNCHPLPTVEICDHIPDALWANYESLMNPPAPLPMSCAGRLQEIPEFYIDSQLERLLLERLERKCTLVRRLLDESHGSWEHCCYWMLARYFGGKANAEPFELLAKSTDMRLLARWRDNPQRVEALLMGQAGLLEGDFDEAYPKQLQTDYVALRQGASLTPMEPHLWKFFRIRPGSFPTLRISQFAQLICQSHNLFSHLLDAPDAAALQRYFSLTASGYWRTHYRFGVPSPESDKRVGRTFADLIIINAWVPLLFEYGVQHGDQACKERAIALLQQLPPENNHVIRQWRAVGLAAGNAARTQALLQLYNEHCIRRDCLRCGIGYKIITH